MNAISTIFNMIKRNFHLFWYSAMYTIYTFLKLHDFEFKFSTSGIIQKKKNIVFSIHKFVLKPT